MDLDLVNARVAVIGATGGLGSAIVDQLCHEGCRLALSARNHDKLRIVAQQCCSSVEYVGIFDVTDHERLEQWCHCAAETLGGIDVLIWTVSAQTRALSASFEAEVISLDRALTVLVPTLERSLKAAIIVIGSQAALLAAPNYASYSASKAALVSYCGSRALGLAGKGIRLNVVSPGDLIFAGSVWDQIREERPQRFASALERHKLGRMGRPEEVAPVVVFLASPRASLVAGAHVLVDGMSRDFVQF